LREEFEALQAPDFDQRGAASNEYLEIFKTAWTQDPASFDGAFYQFKSLRCLPQPLQKPHPPIWIGGHSRPALRRVAKYGDGWHPVGANPAVPLRPPEMKEKIDALKRFTEAEGRDPAALTLSYKAPLYDVTQGGALEQQTGLERWPFSGTTEQIVDDIAAYGRLGVSELIFDVRSETLSESLERLEHFATVIVPAASGA
jgi:alkanesulfonate monooxygenase SsuD/methylene tetrahydromethanopterin reductase-like flavin-dependent oxidoreductase (luciferase family)